MADDERFHAWYLVQQAIRDLYGENPREIHEGVRSRREQPEERLARISRERAELLAEHAARWPHTEEQ
jgi:hypothetical protein